MTYDSCFCSVCNTETLHEESVGEDIDGKELSVFQCLSCKHRTDQWADEREYE